MVGKLKTHRGAAKRFKKLVLGSSAKAPIKATSSQR